MGIDTFIVHLKTSIVIILILLLKKFKFELENISLMKFLEIENYNLYILIIFEKNFKF